jgi:hypothetical protein
LSCKRVLLVRAFRSLLLPLKAVLLNLLSLGATYGRVVLFWQHGIGSEAVFNIAETGAITFCAPLLIFAFLLSRGAGDAPAAPARNGAACTSTSSPAFASTTAAAGPVGPEPTTASTHPFVLLPTHVSRCPSPYAATTATQPYG